MSQRFKPYSDYEESGVAWIGEMPNHWGLQRTKTFFNRMQRPVRPQDGIVTAFRDGEVTLRSNRRTDGFTNAAKEIGYQGVRVDDLVVHAMDGFAGAIGVSDSDGKCSPVYSVCTPKQKDKVHVAYYGYLVRQLAVTDFINSLAKGIRERSTEFRYSEFSILNLAVPPIDEQKQIAAFLDYETAKIDALIEKQQQLIALLGEKRQAVISHAVTKGLNPDAPMRDSGIEWLGEVPEHWEMTGLKHVGHIRYGIGEPPKYHDEGVPLIRATNVRSGTITPIGLVFVNPMEIPDKRIVWLVEGDIVVVRSGAGTGDSAIVPPKYGKAIAGFDMVFRCRGAEAQFVQFALLSSYLRYAQIDQMKMRAAQPHLNAEELGECTFLIPPRPEQLEIIQYLTAQTEKMDTLISRASEAIELMQERRTALISAAVTGKIDVRGWKPPSSARMPETEMELA